VHQGDQDAVKGLYHINRHVAELLNKLLIEEFTKSRSRHSNDNAQVESQKWCHRA
jgi:hypothetical protein